MACLIGNPAKHGESQMTINNLKTVINVRIDAIKASEAVTKAELGFVSRELLAYVPDSKDIGAVNRLIDVLTPKNRVMAVIFFSNFLPWNYDTEAKMFVGMVVGEAKRKRKFDACNTFLKKEESNIWTWAKANIAPMERAKNYTGRIQSVIHAALNDEKDALTPAQVFTAITAELPLGLLEELIEQAFAVMAEEQEKTDGNGPIIDGEIVQPVEQQAIAA
jgi:hypothetical protein